MLTSDLRTEVEMSQLGACALKDMQYTLIYAELPNFWRLLGNPKFPTIVT